MIRTRETGFDDSDYAMMQIDLDRVLSAVEGSSEIDPASKNTFKRDWAVWRHLISVSPLVSSYLNRHASQLPWLLENQFSDFDAAALSQQVDDELMSITDSAEFDRKIRQIRNRHMVLIAIRDLQGLAPLEETLIYLSALADVLVAACLRWQYEKLAQRHGNPLGEDGKKMGLVVLGMGKLGAAELNFSSDIDLILAYEKDGKTDGERVLDHHEFFTRLAQQFYQSLNKTTEDGFVFRVDLRLRPYGNSGPLVMSFGAMEEYYQTQGREWERYAMIKGRAIGMDIQAGENLLKILQPFVYRRYLDFGVIQSLRDLKVMIDKETIKKGRQNNLKLGPGGIREIEFIAQVFQLMRGGQDLALRSRSTPLILQRLAERDLLNDKESVRLISAWQFLRLAENRIQSMYDRQEHDLPKTEVDQQRLSLAMGYDNWPSFLEALSEYRQIAQQCFDSVFAESEGLSENRATQLFWLDISDDVSDADYLSELGYRQSDEITTKLKNLKLKGVYRRLSGRGQMHIDELIPVLIDMVGELDNPDETLTRLLTVINAIAQRESYLALLLEVSPAREQLVRLCGASSWITDEIAHHPVLLDELIDPRLLYSPPGREDINVALTRILVDMNPEDVEIQMERLREFKQAQQLRIAAADIMQTMPLMKVSDHLTWIAESMVNVALELAWEYLTLRHGQPMYEVQGKSVPAQFAVIGFGKLGGIELGYGSDLDLVFVHDSQGQSQFTNGDRSIENGQFFTRLAQRLVHLLATLTPAGVLYEVDMRLRPNGKSGMLVTSVDALASYQREEAWTWEHQALIRARPIAGGDDICEAFQQVRIEILSSTRDADKLLGEVLDMRQRMRTELDKSNAEIIDLKQGVGGIVDIEFMVQYVVLREASRYPQMLEYTDNIRLIGVICEKGLLTADQGRILIDAYREYRACLHHRVLQGLDRCVKHADFESQRSQVIQIWQQLMV